MRASSTVLREARGEIPLAYSPLQVAVLRGDLEVGGAGHPVREGAEMAMILPSPRLSQAILPLHPLASYPYLRMPISRFSPS